MVNNYCDNSFPKTIKALDVINPPSQTIQNSIAIKFLCICNSLKKTGYGYEQQTWYNSTTMDLLLQRYFDPNTSTPYRELSFQIINQNDAHCKYLNTCTSNN